MNQNNRSEIERKIHEMEERGILYPNDYAEITQWASSPDADIRDMAASLLVIQPDEQGKEILLRLADDEDALVRADAFDSLSAFSGPDVLELLKAAAAAEPDASARSYAILACADVALAEGKARDWAEPFFCSVLEREESDRCTLACQYALFLFGDEAAMDRILAYLQHADYQLRCTAVSILQEIVNDRNRTKIQQALCARRAVESAAAVKDRIDSLLESVR